MTGWGDGAKPAASLSTTPFYDKAAANTRVVAKEIGLLVEKIRQNSPVIDFHCIGHSLGAQICGQAGSHTKFARISGLDPAGPLFQDGPLALRLDDSDAAFVDAYHTNAGKIKFKYFLIFILLNVSSIDNFVIMKSWIRL